MFGLGLGTGTETKAPGVDLSFHISMAVCATSCSHFKMYFYRQDGLAL